MSKYYGGFDETTYDETVELSQLPQEVLLKINDNLDSYSTEQWSQTSNQFRNLLMTERFYSRNKSDKYLVKLIRDKKYANDEYFIKKLEYELEKTGRIWTDEEIDEICTGKTLNLMEKLDPQTAINFYLGQVNIPFHLNEFFVSRDRKWFVLENCVIFIGKNKRFFETTLRYMNVHENVIWYLSNDIVYKIDLDTGNEKKMGTIPDIGGDFDYVCEMFGDKTTCIMEFENESGDEKRWIQGEYINNVFTLTTKDYENGMEIKDFWKSQILFESDLGFLVVNKDGQFYHQGANDEAWYYPKLTNVKNEVVYLLEVLEIAHPSKYYLVFFDYVNSIEKSRLRIFGDLSGTIKGNLFLSNDRTQILASVFDYDQRMTYVCKIDAINKIVSDPIQTGNGNTFLECLATNSGTFIVPLNGGSVYVNSKLRGINTLITGNSKTFCIIEDDFYAYYRDTGRLNVFHL
jgi:hypothetical protein